MGDYFTAALTSFQQQLLNTRLRQRAVWEKVYFSLEQCILISPAAVSILTAMRLTSQFHLVLLPPLPFCAKAKSLNFHIRSCAVCFSSVLTYPGFGGIAHENDSCTVSRAESAQHIWTHSTQHSLFRPHSHLKSFCRWTETSDVYCHWRNVVRAWVKTWKPLAHCLC